MCLTPVFDHWQIADADRLRRAIGNCFERASYPTMSPEERSRTLTFVVVGAGPTGIGEWRARRGRAVGRARGQGRRLPPRA